MVSGCFDMTVAYINEQGTLVRRSHKSLLITQKGEVRAELPIGALSGLLIFGNAQLTTPAIALLMDNGVDVHFFSLYGRYKGKISSASSKNVFVRLAQQERWHNLEYRLNFDRALVKAKILNQRSLLQRNYWNHPENKELAENIKRLKNMSGAAANGAEEASLRGIEGSAAAMYFSSFGQLLKADLGFAGRKRRPPTDPVNALLSLGYTLLTAEISAILDANGFDPCIGMYHWIRYGRVSLALDFIEPFRAPIIDATVLWLVNLKVIRKEHFEKQTNDAMYLNEEGRRIFFSKYEEIMGTKGNNKNNNWRNILLKETASLKQIILTGADFVPFIWRE